MPSDFSMLSGLFRGMVDRNRGDQAREQQKEMFGLEKANKQLQQMQLKIAQQRQQMQMDREARLWKFWEQRQTGSGQKPSQSDGTDEGDKPQFGKGFEGGEGVTDQLAGYGIDPFMAAMGPPEMGKLFEYGHKERDFARKSGQDEWNRDKDIAAGEWLESEGPQGKTKTRVPKYPGLGGGAPQSFQSGMPPIDLKKRQDPNTGETYEVPVNKNTGQEVGQRMPVAPLKGESAEASAKIALANQGLGHVTSIANKFINPDGSVNRKLVLQANAPMGGIGEGRQTRATFLDALDARARAATGAAMPDSEVANYTRMYFPSVLDNDAAIKDKLKRLKGFLKDYMEALDPSGIQRKRLNKKADFVYNPATGKLEPVK